MLEGELSRLIVGEAEDLGWRVYTIRNTRAAGLRSHTGVGFPDLVMVRGGRLIAAELKRRTERPTAEQQQWLDAFSQVPGASAFVWRPADLEDGTILEHLKED